MHTRQGLPRERERAPYLAGAKEFGIQAPQPSVDFALSQARKQKVVDQLYRGLANLMSRRRITVLAGAGTLLPGSRVHVESENGQTEISDRHVMLATGSVPRSLRGFDVDGELILASDDELGLDPLPPSVAIVGGGAVGCEFASMFSDLGVQVTMVEALDTLLPGSDADLVARVRRVRSASGAWRSTPASR
jgi:dihydrolipoamide dehydrogenase